MKKKCTVDGCERPLVARGYCSTHYAAARARGEFGHPPCIIDGCDRVQQARQMCSAHWQNWRYHLPEDLRPKRKQPKPCKVEGCERTARGRGWCNTHFVRWQRTGDPGDAEIVTPRESGSGWIDENGYQRYSRKRKVIFEHRQVMEQAIGRSLETHETVHHINGDRLDNRIENLQLRSGRHGKGVAHQCLDCGSGNVKAVEI